MPGEPEGGQEEAKEQEAELPNPPADQQDQQDVPVVRELTQTDRLNKKLLSSLLERMNSDDSLTERFKNPEERPQTSNETEKDEFAP